MPGQLDIKNNSKTTEVLLSIVSIDGKLVHVKNKPLVAEELTSVVVKGGTKKLTVFTSDGTALWDGVVPSYGTSVVDIFPDTAIVKYKDITLVNLLKYNTLRGNGILSSRMQIGIAICLLGLVIAVAAYYIRKK